MCGSNADHDDARNDNDGSENVVQNKGRNWQGEWRKTPGRLIGIGIIKVYQFLLSPIIGSSCRHLPTCSEFGYEAIARHGLVSGSWLTFWRVLKCNPFGKAGYDPVPKNMRWFKTHKNENKK